MNMEVFLPFEGIQEATQSVVFSLDGALDPHREPARTSGLGTALKAYSLRDKAVSLAKAGAALCVAIADAHQWELVKKAVFNFARISLCDGAVTAINLADAPGSFTKAGGTSFVKNDSTFGVRHVVKVQPGLSDATMGFLTGTRHVAKVQTDLTSSGVSIASQGGLEYAAQAMKCVMKASDFIRAAAAEHPLDDNLKQASTQIMSAVGWFRALETGTPQLNGTGDLGNKLDPPNATQTEVNSARQAFVVDTNLLHAKYMRQDQDAAVAMFKNSRLRRRGIAYGR
jgi:hypothetical protein